MHIETHMDIGAKIVYANTGVHAYINDETRVMINLLGWDRIVHHLDAPLDMHVICLS